MTTTELDKFKKEVDKATKYATDLVREYEQLQIDFLSSNTDLNIGDIIEVNNVKYSYGGYILPTDNSSYYNIIPRTPIPCGFKIKKNGEPSKNKTYLYAQSNLISNYGKNNKGKK